MQELAARFVPAADEVGRLQRGEDQECRLFQDVARHGHYGTREKPTPTRQGIYAATASGVFLASVNTRNPRQMIAMLERALAKWEELSPAERHRSDETTKAATRRWEDRFPDDGLALRVVVRDLPREGDPELHEDDWRRHAWNQDFAWYTKEEAAQLLPAELVAGTRHEVPTALVARLVRCHLVDNVRGQTPSFAAEDVKRAELAVTVVSVADGVAELRLDGRTRAVARGRWPVSGFADMDDPQEQIRSVATELLGHAQWDVATSRFTDFELLALGTRQGGTQYNARHDDLGAAPIGFALTRVAGAPQERVAPANVWHYGWRW